MNTSSGLLACAGSVLAAVLVVGCVTTPHTGRRQLILLPESKDISLGIAAYRQVLKESTVSTDPRYLEVVERVGRRIAEVAERPDYQWEFTVIEDDKMVNAFALPGGKIAVYTGLFPVARDEAGLAIILGHEVAHAIARHGAERMSQGILTRAGAIGLQLGMARQDGMVAKGVLAAYGLGAKVGVLLPFSRLHESEADKIGLILSAKAGYDPRAAVGLWERMAERADGKAPPRFLSTHPGPRQRIEQIEAWLPEIVPLYTPSDVPVQLLPALTQPPGSS